MLTILIEWLPKADDFYDLGTLPSYKSSKAHLRGMKNSKTKNAPNNAFVVQDLEGNVDL